MLPEPLFYILLACLFITVFDIVGAILSRVLVFNYGWFTVGSIIIYGFVSIQVAALSTSFNGFLAGCFLGLFDAIVGAFIGKKLKPNIGDMEGFSWEVTPGLVFSVTLLGGLISLLSIWIFL